MNRIERKFKELKKNHKKAFIVFITAGYPNLNVTRRLILGLTRAGVDIIELGVPFSDPLADGPIIQEASQAALKKRVNIREILNLVKRVRRDTDIPICLMTYYNPVFCFGEERFAKEARASGVDGIIIPDLPPEEGRLFAGLASRIGLDAIFFLAPTSNLERIKIVSGISKGFIYYVSLTGVTGPRKKLPPDLISNLETLKKHTDKPVCVGFGVSKPLHIKQIYAIAEGVIVGSAIVKKIKENIDKPDLVKKVINFVCYLKGKRCTARQY